MAIKGVFFMFLTIAFLMLNGTTSTRNFPLAPESPLLLDLATRLQAGDDSSNTTTTDCWSSLSEIRTCSNEIIGFFLNGYTDIDTPCCQAIEVIIHHCWPSMLSVLGFTTEEGNLLAAYCKESAAAPVGAPPETESTAALVGEPPETETESTVGSHF